MGVRVRESGFRNLVTSRPGVRVFRESGLSGSPGYLPGVRVHKVSSGFKSGFKSGFNTAPKNSEPRPTSDQSTIVAGNKQFLGSVGCLALALGMVGCDTEEGGGPRGLGDALRGDEVELETVEIMEPGDECELVPHVFNTESVDIDQFHLEIVPIYDPEECEEPVEFELNVTVEEVEGQPIEASGGAAGPTAASSYYLYLAGQAFQIGNGPSFTFSYQFALPRYWSWSVHVALVQYSNLGFQSVATTNFAFAAPYYGGGGQYRGPGDVVPGWVQPYGGGQRPPPWNQIPQGASRRTVCSGLDPSICVSGLFWDAAATQVAQQGFCAAAQAEHNQMEWYRNSQNWPGYPRASCINTTGITNDMYSSLKTRCTTPQPMLACSAWQPWNMTNFQVLDLTTDVLSTRNLWVGCNLEMDNNVSGC